MKRRPAKQLVTGAFDIVGEKTGATCHRVGDFPKDLFQPSGTEVTG